MILPSGASTVAKGVITSSADSFQIRMFGRGAHGRCRRRALIRRHGCRDGVRLQTIVSVRLAPTIPRLSQSGSLQAGTKENVIPDEAIIKLNVRTFDEGIRNTCARSDDGSSMRRQRRAPRAPGNPSTRPILAGQQRCEAQRGSPRHSVKQISASGVGENKPTMASEDFGSFGAEWRAPAVYWFIGGRDHGCIREGEEATGRLWSPPTIILASHR